MLLRDSDDSGLYGFSKNWQVIMDPDRVTRLAHDGDTEGATKMLVNAIPRLIKHIERYANDASVATPNAPADSEDLAEELGDIYKEVHAVLKRGGAAIEDKAKKELKDGDAMVKQYGKGHRQIETCYPKHTQ